MSGNDLFNKKVANIAFFVLCTGNAILIATDNFTQHIQSHLLYISIIVGLSSIYVLRISGSLDDNLVRAIKFASWLLFTLALAFATSNAARQLASFGGSPSIMPWAYMFVSYILFAEVCKYPLALALLLVIISLMFHKSFSGYQKCCLIMLAANLVVLFLHSKYVSDSTFKDRVDDMASIAYEYDFSRHTCNNIPRSSKVLFTGDGNGVIVLTDEGRAIMMKCNLDEAVAPGVKLQNNENYARPS